MPNLFQESKRARASPHNIIGRRRVALKGLPKPTLHHPELESVYKTDADITTAEQVAEWLALPRTTLIADARAILRDGIERYDELREQDYTPETHTFPIHALNILAAVDAVEALRDVLDYFRMEDGFLEFWFGDIQDRLIQPIVFALGRNRPEEIFAYLREPHLYYFNRVWPAHAVGDIWNHHPEHRATIEAGYLDLLDYFLNDPAEGTLDVEFISSVLVDITCIGVPGGLPRIKKLFDRRLAFAHVNGDYRSIEKQYGKGFSAYEVQRMPLHPHEWWTRSYRKYPLPPQAKVKKDSITFQSAPRLASPTAPRVADAPIVFTKNHGGKRIGRNDPCPCGSGVKYKKCCLKRT